MAPDARPRGPGLAKAGAPPLLRERRVELIAGCAARLRALLESADVVSEGGERLEAGDRVYYGCTSLVIALPALETSPARLARLLELDPHVRVLALRVARREACVRAAGALGPVSAELSVRLSPEAERATVSVDVMAPVLRGAARPSRA